MFVGQGEWGAVDVYLYKFSGLVSWVMTLLNFRVSKLLHSKTFFVWFLTVETSCSTTLTDLRER